jgi:hypothetical protein
LKQQGVFGGSGPENQSFTLSTKVVHDVVSKSRFRSISNKISLCYKKTEIETYQKLITAKPAKAALKRNLCECL